MKFADPKCRPTVEPPRFENIPTDLRRLDQWIIWRFEWRENEWAKVPIEPHTGRWASSTNSKTWGSFDAAREQFEIGKDVYDGIGFVFSENDSFTGVDFDNCMEGDRVSDFAREWVKRFDSYCEKSVSGTGLHVICKGVVGKGMKAGDFEIYSTARYFTFSGNVGKRKMIEDRQNVVDDFKNFLRPKESRTGGRVAFQPPAGCPSIHERLEKAFHSQNGHKIRALHDGSVNGYRSNSEADLAYLSLAAFYSSNDPSVLDEMYRSSKLMRAKWEREDYRSETISKALSGCSEFYDFTKNGNGNAPKVEPTSTSEKSADAEERTTDLGNARRLVRLHRNDIRYCHDFRKWLVYDKGRWRLDSTGEAVRRAKATVQTI